MLALIPICWLKSLRSISYISLITLIGMFLSFFAIIYFSAETIIKGEHRYHETKTFDIIRYPFFAGIVMLGFNGNTVSLNLRASMKRKQDFDKAVVVSTIIVVSVTV